MEAMLEGMLEVMLRQLARHAALALLPAVAVMAALGSAIPAPEALAQPVAAGAPIKAGALVIEAPWMRATPGGAKVAAGYVKITNTGSSPDRLTGGTLPTAGTVEVHEMTMADGVMRMRRLAGGLEIKPGRTVELRPGGHHLMFLDLSQPVKQGAPLKGTLTFEKAGSVEVEFSVAPIGAPAGGHSGGHHMKH